MFHDADALLLARLQFGFTVSFHFIFPSFSIGLASYLAVLEASWLKTGKTLYLAGQISIDPKTKQLNTGTIEEQTKLVLENLKAVLAADGLTMDHVVSTSVFLKDLNEFAKMNEVYGTYFKNAPPARATVEVARLPRDVKVEISAIAVHP